MSAQRWTVALLLLSACAVRVAKNIAAGPGTPKEIASVEPKTGLRKGSQGYRCSLMETTPKISHRFAPCSFTNFQEDYF
jgi:hypothetical protein